MLRLHRLALASALVALASAAHAAPAPTARPTKSAKAAAHEPAGPKMVLPFIEDDWTRAVALAKQRKVPIFVESWAPW